MMNLRGLRSCFPLLKNGLKKNLMFSEKTILILVSSLFSILGSDLHTEFHELFMKFYLGFWTWIKPMVRIAAIKPPSSSIILDKSSNSEDLVL